MMDRQSKQGGLTKEELQEFLDKGGKIQYLEYGQRTENIDYKGGFYGKKKKKEDTGK